MDIIYIQLSLGSNLRAIDWHLNGPPLSTVLSIAYVRIRGLADRPLGQVSVHSKSISLPLFFSIIVARRFTALREIFVDEPTARE